MPSEVVDLHICICIRNSHWLYGVRIGCTPQLHCRTLLRRRCPSFPAVLTCFHLFATIWREVTWLLMCSNCVRARSSWGVCCMWYDWWRLLSWSAVLSATLWHCQELSDERYAHHIQFEFWLLRRLTLAVTDRSPPVLRCQHSVPSVSSTMLLLQRVCCSVLAASLLAASYIFLLTFSVLYYATDSFFPLYRLVFS